MPSTTSLYTTTATQEVASSDTTSLYGGTGLPVPASGGTTVRGNLTVTGDLLVQQDATIDGELTVGQDLCIEGDTITLRCNATTPANALIEVERGSFPNAEIAWNESTDRWETNFGVTVTGLTAGDVNIAPNANDNLISTVGGSGQDLRLDADTNQIQFTASNLLLNANTNVRWNENDTGSNRLEFQSTSGNGTGMRMLAPTTAVAGQGITRFIMFNTSDVDNGNYLTVRAGQAGDDYRIVTGTFTGGVESGNSESVNFYSYTTKYASVNPAGPTNAKDLVTLEYLTAGSFVFDQVNIDNTVFLDSGTLTTSAVTPNQTLNSFPAASYASAKYQIQVKSGADVHVMEIMVMHDGTTAYQMVYAEMFSNASLTSTAVTLSGGDVILQVTPVNAVTTYKISRTLVAA